MPIPAYTPVLKTKITIPPPRPQLVSRRRLLEQLHEGLKRPFTLISAPAGFGKTTLVSNWLNEVKARPRVAWLSLEEDDNDPSRFLYYIVAALQTVEPGVGRAPILLFGSSRVPTPKDLITLLFNELVDTSESIVLVLDDYHAIANPDIDSALTFFVDHAPEQLRLIVATREEPNLPLARWRSHQSISEIGLEDLRFTLDEAQLFLQQTMGLELDVKSVKALDARTEGWVAGLQMAALSLQHHARTDGVNEAAQMIAAFSGEHRYVMDYLAAEVLRQQPPDIHAFLHRTAILDRLCAPLCDAVAERTDSKAILSRLEQANMFLLRLDDQRHWYRYHQLFADFLRTDLDAAEEQGLHRKACAWHEAHGFGRQAMKHALAARDVPAGIRVFRANVESMLGHGENPTLLAWLEALPDDAVRARGDLAGYKAWLLYMRGQTGEAKDYAALAGMAEDADVPATRHGISLALQAIMAINWGNPQQAVLLARQALNQFGDNVSFFRVHALSFLGQAQGLSGNPTMALVTLRQAIELAKKLGNHLIALDALAHLVPLMYAQGKLREAMLLCRNAAAQHVDARSKALPVAGPAYIQLGVLYYELNDLEEAQQCLTTGIALCQQLGMVYHTLVGQRTLAKVQYLGGDRETAWNTLAAARELAEWSDSPRRQRLVIAVTAELQLREGNIEAAARTLGDLWATTNALSEHERLVHAQLLLAQNKLNQAENELRLLEENASKEKREGSLIAIYVAQALCKQASGKRPAAFKRLEHAVSLAASNGYHRVFLDYGPAVAPLLRQARHVAPGYVAGLLAEFPDAEKAAVTADTLVEPLSSGQVEILRLLDLGLTNQEIAAKLAITVGTTKWHLNQIFGKLEVHNRMAAVAKARQLGLL